MTLTKEIKNKIKKHSLEELPNECCGLVVENEKTKAIEVFRCENKSETKHVGFSLSPRDYLKASRTGEILATYHSHPDDSDKFSLIDKANSRNNNINYVLYCVKKDKFLEYSPSEPYENYFDKDFEVGVNDCITFGKKFYEQELGIHVNKNYSWSFFDKVLLPIKKGDPIPKEWIDMFEEVGLEKLEFDFSKTSNFKKNDCIIVYPEKRKFICHLLYYVGNEQVIFHPRNGRPQIRDYGKFFIKNTACVFRKKE